MNIYTRFVIVLVVILMIALSIPLPNLADVLSKHTNLVSVTIRQQSSSHISLTIDTEIIEIIPIEINEHQFHRIRFDAEHTLQNEGYPEIPFVSRSILIPQGAEVSLEIENVISHIEENISPIISPRLVDGEIEAVELNQQLSLSDSFFPKHPIELGEISVLRGYTIINLRFYPVQTKSVSGQAKINDKIEFTLNFDLKNSNHQTIPEIRFASISAFRSISNLVQNPPPPPERDDLQNSTYLYIAPNVNGVAESIVPLIEWRRRQGFRVAVEMVANGASAGTIGRIIDDYYESEYPIEYVALIGDAAGAIRLSAATQFGDYNYTRVDGNDPLPDIALGRISVSSINELDRVVNKLVSYESDPYMNDTDWYKQGAVIAGATINGMGTVILGKYVRKEMLDLGYDEVNHWYHNELGNIGGNQEFLTDQFDWGISVLHYRAYSRMNGLNLNIVRNLPGRNGRWAAVLAVSCNTGNFIPEESYSEAFFRGRGGGIGAIGTATPNTNVKFNNIMAGGVWKGIWKDKNYMFGWGLNSGKYQLWRAYAGFDGGYMNFMEWNNFIGDPGTHIWTDIPQIINAEHVAQIPVGSTDFSIHVEIEDDGGSVEAALVCLYKDDELHLTAYTDDDGNAGFAIEPELLSEGEMMVTITKHNHKPYLTEVDIVDPENYIGLLEWNLDDDGDGQSAGNDNGIVNPGETIELTVSCQNFGENIPDGEVSFMLNSLAEWAEVMGNPPAIERAPDPGAVVDVTFVIEFNASTPDKEALPFQLIIELGEAVWTSRFDIIPESPKIKVERIIFTGGSFRPGSNRLMNLVIENVGHSRLEAFNATITTDVQVVRAINEEASYPAISPNQDAVIDGNLFRLMADDMTIPGLNVPFEIIIESESGFRDTTVFNVVVGVKGEGDPLGPDSYGYICLDSGDEDWEFAPVYEWIEIDPDENNNDFNGEVLDLNDRRDNGDVSTVVDLPFDFMYYGEEFDQITICSNGWAAFGDQEGLADFRNRRIAQALGPNAQLCVWWDNLVVTNNASITVAYDEDGGRYIIEWNNVGRLLDGGGIGARETFEIVLYDPEVHQTPSGDGVILFQYKDVTNENRAAHNDTPYCTIGIGNLDDSDGIEYTYWNTYPEGAAEIRDEMALLFIKQSDFRVSVLEGTVVDEETGEPISSADIITSQWFRAETNDEGFYRIDNIILGENYDISAYAQGWNDSTLSGFEIVSDETLTVNFSLLHPEIYFDTEQFDIRQYQNEEHSESINIGNSGNGLLEWSTEKRIRGHEEIAPWELREQIFTGAEIQDDRLYGAIYTGDHFYVAGRNDRDPQIYVLDDDGNLISQFPQFMEGEDYGIRDLAWDGELIWGGLDNQIYGFTTDGELVSQFDSPINSVRRLAWDGDRELLWVSTTTSNIFGIDAEGNLISELNRHDLLNYGLAYWQEDPDGYPLYIFFYRNGIGDQVVYKMNPDTEDTMFVRLLQPENEGRANGAFISGEYDPYNWSFISSINNIADDRIDIWHLEPRLSWFVPDPEEGELTPEDEMEIVLMFDTALLPTDTFEADLIFKHNAGQGESVISITLEVLAGGGENTQRTLELQSGWNLVSLNIEPDESDIEIITQNLVDAGILNIVKNGTGQFYSPRDGFNNIEFWDFTEGYQINVSEAADLTVEGVGLDPRTAIPLTEGWNMSAYLLQPPVAAVVGLSGIVEQLEIAKDGDGMFYLPEFGFSNMGSLREGLGYQYKVSEDVDLVYQMQEQLAITPNENISAVHFADVDNSAYNMSVLAISDDIKPGWELGVFDSEGSLLGSGVFNEYGASGVAVWGSEHSEEINSTLLFKVWNGEIEIQAELEPIKGDNNWTRDGVLIGNLSLDVTIPIEFGIYEAYPNPFNSRVQLKYGLIEKGQITLKIYYISGREVAVLTDRVVEAGIHKMDWNPTGLSSGVYFARLVQADNVAIEKLMLLK